MKKVIFLRKYPNAIGGAERYLNGLKNKLSTKNLSTQIRFYKGKKIYPSWLKALLYNKQVCTQKQKNELYFSLERVECADIFRTDDGVHKVYRTTKPFWFLNPLNFVYTYLEKKCFKNAKTIIAISLFIKKQIIETYKIDENKIKLIYNGINFPAKVEKGNAKLRLNSEYGISYELPTLIFVGNGFKRKGLKDFLQIVSKLEHKVNSIVIGKDKNIRKYENLAKQLNINTLFLGEQANVSKFYEAADIFLFPTIYEPFGNVVIEAMSYGCVCITTAQSGASEALQDKFIMKSHKDYTISKTIDEILKDNDIMHKIQNENMIKSKEFNIDKNAQLTLDIINEYIN